MSMFTKVRGPHPCRGQLRRKFQVEVLEARSLPSLSSVLTMVAPLAAQEPNDTADLAQELGDLTTSGGAVVQGDLGQSPAGAAEVDWFRFTLDAPADVTVTSQGLPSVLSLYDEVPFDFFDPFAQTGLRLLTQTQSPLPATANLLERPLAAGTYDVAISGAGDRYYHPFLAGSGLAGATGAYELSINARSLGLDPTANPVLLTSDPAQGAQLLSSPFVLRLAYSAPVNVDSVIPDDTVFLTYNPTGAFGDGNDQDIPIAQVNFSTAANELQLTPSAPLAPGYYQVFLAGNTVNNFDVITDMNGTPLGTDALDPNGQDTRITFQVTGSEGIPGTPTVADDTPAGAHQLGDLTQAGLVQQVGAIGADPTAPVPFDPADVDLYHFTIQGPGRYAFSAEVFAQRIGSPLKPGVSLFEMGSDGLLHVVAGNDGTHNTMPASNGKSLPLFSDAALFLGLTAGNYYVAVSSHGNVPDPAEGLLPGQDGIFDPNIAHSGSAGRTIGNYVLNLLVQPDDVPPTVVAVTPGPGTFVFGPPTQLVVQFSKPVDLRALALQAFEQSALAPAYLEGSDGTRYFPRLESYDDATNQAVFQMLDRLAAGDYTVHLSGPAGLADFAGNPLVGTGSGDYTSSFTVAGPVPSLQSQEPNDSLAEAQNLDVLFPHELQDGVTLERTSAAGRADQADFYRFQVLQDQTYLFFLTGSSGLQLTLYDAAGNVVTTAPQGPDGQLALITAGTYVIEVSGWTPAQAAQIMYELRITLGGNGENPPPLTVGPAPVIRFRLAAVEMPAVLTSVVVPAAAASANSPVVTPALAVSEQTTPVFQALAVSPGAGVTSSSPIALGPAPERLVLPTPTIAALAPTLSLAASIPASGGVLVTTVAPSVVPTQPTLFGTLGQLTLPGPQPFNQAVSSALERFLSLLDWLDSVPTSSEEPAGNADAPPGNDGERQEESRLSQLLVLLGSAAAPRACSERKARGLR